MRYIKDDSVWDTISSPLENYVQSSVPYSVMGSVWHPIWDSICDSVLESIWVPVRDQEWESMFWYQIRSQEDKA